MADRAYRNAVLLDNYRGPKGPMPNLFSVKDASEVSAAILGEQVRKVRVWGQRLRGLA